MRALKKYFHNFSVPKVVRIAGMLLIFLIALRPPTDPDLGWHLQDGQYLASHHLTVARQDIFSYTMPNFPLIMHEWVTDYLMFIVSHFFGLFALSVIFALVISAAFILVSQGVAARKEYKIIAAVLGTIASIPVLGVRPQMLSLLLLACVIYIVFIFRRSPETKLIYWMPLIFLAWVNLHGGFAIGLFFLFLFLLVEYLKIAIRRRLRPRFQGARLQNLGNWLERNSTPAAALLKLDLAFFISLAVTFINPYGWRIYIEVFTTITDSYAKNLIGEWLHISVQNPLSYEFLGYLTLLAILLLFSYRSIDYTYLILTVPFLYLAFSSWRHEPIFMIISTPLWVFIVDGLAGKELQILTRKRVFLAGLILAIIFFGHQQIKESYADSASVSNLARAGNYPLGAILYLKAHPIGGNMFNEYNWGGFLIWQYPEKKVYIDGRMASWKIGDYSIFKEFNDTMQFQDGWEETLAKHDIAFALVYNNPVNEYQFSHLGWKKIYGDNISLVFERPN